MVLRLLFGALLDAAAELDDAKAGGSLHICCCLGVVKWGRREREEGVIKARRLIVQLGSRC